MFELLYWFFIYYVKLYVYSLPLLFVLFWFWISYVDRLHMRERSRRLGERIRLVCLKFKYWYLVEKYILIQLNGLAEMTSGFTYGILNKNEIIKIVETKQNEMQTDISGEQEPQIIIKEVIKEIIVDNIIKEVEIDDNIIKEKVDNNDNIIVEESDVKNIKKKIVLRKKKKD